MLHQQFLLLLCLLFKRGTLAADPGHEMLLPMLSSSLKSPVRSVLLLYKRREEDVSSPERDDHVPVPRIIGRVTGGAQAFDLRSSGEAACLASELSFVSQHDSFPLIHVTYIERTGNVCTADVAWR